MIKTSVLNLEVLFWDFDGVLMRSNEIRDMGFELVLASYPKHQVEKLMAFHRKNGGLSRYVKFRYFFEEIRGEEIKESQITVLAQAFSEIMRKKLNDNSLLIDETISFVKKSYGKLPQYIVSGSDQEELRHLCLSLGIKNFFEGIFGSPTPKKQLINQVLKQIPNLPERCLMIGDSINDFDAAVVNGLHFWAYGNPELSAKSTVSFSL